MGRRLGIGGRLKPALAKGGVFTFWATWRDPEGDEIDPCADALWHLTHEGAIEAA